ncbi:unnamed protein product [Cuscuta campestris]|uniref:Uncharacterized protein n=1 Tax=Cuscuta campestris TaxID=132261 RepID=A0A484N8I1_9ASTE|nr:unnamed protein product [Cuscuta campestris]
MTKPKQGVRVLSTVLHVSCASPTAAAMAVQRRRRMAIVVCFLFMDGKKEAIVIAFKKYNDGLMMIQKDDREQVLLWMFIYRC